MSSRTRPGRGARARTGRVERAGQAGRAPTGPTASAPNAFWPLACAAAAATVVFLVGAGYWSPSAGVLGASRGSVDGAIALAAALLLAAAATPLRGWWSTRGR